jgi:hypothetical protein
MLIRRLEAVVPQVLFRVLAQTGVPCGGARSSRMWCHGRWVLDSSTHDDKDSTFVRNVGKDQPSNMAPTFQHSRFLIRNSNVVEVANTALTVTSTRLGSARTCLRPQTCRWMGRTTGGLRVRMLAGFSFYRQRRDRL